MDLFLGLDGGGTKTASVILTGTGDELGRGRGGPCNIATSSDEQLQSSVSEACSTALEAAGLQLDTRFGGVCAGVAGYTAKRRRAVFTRFLAEIVNAERHRVEPDFKIAFWGATEGEPGIVVSAGTGAVVYGLNAAGEECREDGRGFLLGDRGSAFDLGHKTLSVLMSKLDLGFPLNPLDVATLDWMGAEDADDVVEWTYRDFSPAKIASIAELISARAAAGDNEAIFALQGQGAALRASLDYVTQALRAPQDTPVYLLGSLWSAGGAILRTFSGAGPRSPEAPPPVSIRQPRHDAAYGAALLAMRSPP
jgi:N-acetylglucosamine kinase-like BadF-type ATPase